MLVDRIKKDAEGLANIEQAKRLLDSVRNVDEKDRLFAVYEVLEGVKQMGVRSVLA